MAALLQQLINNQHQPNGVIVESAGVSNSARKGGSAPELSQKLAPTYGVDLSNHNKRNIDDVDLSEFDLFVAADKEVQSALLDAGVKSEIICLELMGAANAWKALNPRKVEDMIHSIYTALLREVMAYKFRLNDQ